MLKKLTFLSSISFLLMGCKNVENDSAETPINKTFVVVDSIHLPIGFDEYFYSNSSHFLTENDTTFLYRSSIFQSTIDVYNWDTKKLYKKIDIENSGVNRMSYFKGYHYPITKDSLFIPVPIGRVYVMKDNEVVLKNYFNNYDIGYLFFCPQNIPLIKYKDDIVLRAIPDTQEFTKPESFLKPNMARYSLKKDTLIPLAISYPEFYKDKCWSGDQYDILYTLKDNILFCQYAAGGDIISYNLDTNEKSTFKKPGSKFTEWSTIPLNKCGEYATPSSWIQNAQKPIHNALIYDQFQDIFYLITHLPVKNIDVYRKAIIDNQNSQNYKPISIMVLDNTFKLIDEILLPEKSYNTQDFLVTEDGLHLSKNNEAGDHFDENQIKYDVLKLILNEI